MERIKSPRVPGYNTERLQRGEKGGRCIQGDLICGLHQDPRRISVNALMWPRIFRSSGAVFFLRARKLILRNVFAENRSQDFFQLPTTFFLGFLLIFRLFIHFIFILFFFSFYFILRFRCFFQTPNSTAASKQKLFHGTFLHR